MENIQQEIDNLNFEIRTNSEDYNNGSISYDELTNIQETLIKKRDELLEIKNKEMN